MTAVHQCSGTVSHISYIVPIARTEQEINSFLPERYGAYKLYTSSTQFQLLRPALEVQQSPAQVHHFRFSLSTVMLTLTNQAEMCVCLMLKTKIQLIWFNTF